MALSNEQITSLLNMVAVAEPDEVDCDGCLEHLAEFAEAELFNREVSGRSQNGRTSPPAMSLLQR